jgi:arylsulfatase A-like enzyme/Flp pilus assembly protein TadD
MDTTRADHFGCYGHESIRTPHIDALARRSLRFDRCFSTVPITLPSHTTMLTGLYPPRHSVRDNGTFSFPQDIPTLATILGGKGWRTIGVVGAFPLTRPFGLQRGFDIWDEDFGTRKKQLLPLAFEQRSADRVTRTALRLLEENPDRPFFLFVHYFDPHRPWEAPALYATQYRESPYDAEIAYTDAWIGQLLEGVEDLGLGEQTIVILTADHGEGLSDHAEETHSFLLYNGTIRVPLLVSGPGIEPGVVDRPVSLADIAPTVLELVGVQAPQNLDGVSLLRPAPDDRIIYSESLAGRLQHGWNDMRAAVADGRKLILGAPSEIYDVQHDLPEVNDLRDVEPEATRDLENRLRQFIENIGAPHSLKESFSAADEDIRAGLEALGYVVAEDVVRDWSELGALKAEDDPRLHLELIEVQSIARSLINEGNIPLALEIVDAALASDPEDLKLLRLEVIAHIVGGDGEAAVIYANRMEVLGVPEPQDLRLFAMARRTAGDLDGALGYIRHAQALDDDLGLRHLEVELLGGLGRMEEVQALLDELLQQNPCDRESLRLLGISRRWTHDLEGMETAYLLMLGCDPRDVRAHYNLGNVRFERGDLDGAEAAFLKAAEVEPSYGAARFGLALVAIDRGDPGSAMPLLERVVTSEPVNSGLGRKAAALLSQLEEDRDEYTIP